MDLDSHIRSIGGAADAFSAAAPSAGTKPDGDKSDFLKTLDEIREKGLQAYADEQRAKKLEELRQKILGSMGLTEDSLAAQSPEQRDAIEKAVNDEIKKRLAAGSLMEGDSKSADPVRGVLAIQDDQGAGMAMLQAMEERFERY